MFGARDPFSGSMTELLAKYKADGKGVAFVIFKVPANAQKHDFPVPEITWHDGYLDFSDAPPETFHPKMFNPRHHLYRVNESKYVLMGIVGPAPTIFNWAPDWLKSVREQIRYERWTRKAFIVTSQEIEDADPDKPAPAPDSAIIKPGDTDWLDAE